jgi:hypothetical protein
MKYSLRKEERSITITFTFQGEVLAELTLYRSEAEKKLRHVQLRQFFGERKSGARFYFEEKLIEERNPELIEAWVKEIDFSQEKDISPEDFS